MSDIALETGRTPQPHAGNGKHPLPDVSEALNARTNELLEQAIVQANAPLVPFPVIDRYLALPVEEVAADPAARKMGMRMFANNCAQCHGADLQGGNALAQEAARRKARR